MDAMQHVHATVRGQRLAITRRLERLVETGETCGAKSDFSVCMLASLCANVCLCCSYIAILISLPCICPLQRKGTVEGNTADRAVFKTKSV